MKPKILSILSYNPLKLQINSIVFWMVLFLAFPFGRAIAVDDKSGEIVNRVRYIVGDIPITQIDIEQMEKRIRRMKQKPPGGMSLSRYAIDQLIMRAIVEMEARDESVIVSDERIQNEVKRRMEFAGIDDEDRFRRLLESETGLKFEDWVDDLRFELKKRQIIQIKVTVPVPERSEIEEFYRKNKSKIGYEVSYREIILRIAGGGIKEEQRISNLARDLWTKLKQNPGSFSGVARNTPENVSPYKSAGGLRSYSALPDIARENQVLAGVLSRLKPGQVSTVFRDSSRNYYIVKMEDIRPVRLAKVENMIRQRLYFEREDEAFEKWIQQRKKETSIREL